MKKNSIKSLRDKYKADIKKQENYRNKQMLKNQKIMEEQFKEFEKKDTNIVNEEIEPDNKVIEKVILKDSYTLFF
jgi:hypothetical protein|tara:strand:+ start:121 stop:345 length:225 start_codon:yes stop_codon:yes gene_type:complete